MIPSNVLPNLAKVEQLLKKTPNATHVYMRTDDGRPGYRYVDIPLSQAEFTIRNKPNWTVENLAVSDVKHTPTQNMWPGTKISEIGKNKMETPALPADAAPVEVPPKPSEEEKKEEPAAPADTAASTTAAPADTTAPVKSKYSVLKKVKIGDVEHKKGAELELTDEEAAALPSECLKKIDA